MPWIKEEKLYPLVILLLIFIMAARMPLDSDMWWHLRAGEETLNSGEVYRIDTFSSSRSGMAWVNHSWLSQVIMAGIFRLGEYSALTIWVACCAVLSMGFVYLQSKGHPLLRSAVLILAAMVSSVVWSPRPQIMSLVMLALISWLVHQYREKRTWQYLGSIPFVFLLWGNLHGGYVLGLIYLGGYMAGEMLDRLLFRESTGLLTWKEIGLMSGMMILGLVLVLVNPFGFEMWMIPFNTVGVENLQNLINEWASPDFHQVFQQPFLWMLIGLFVVVGLTGKRISGHQLVPVALFSGAALLARRNFGPFAIVSAPVLANQLSSLFEMWLERAQGAMPFFDRFLKSAEENKQNFNTTARNLTNATLIILLAFTAVIKVVQVTEPELLERVEKQLFPVDAVGWIQSQGQPYRIFNDYNWGGYLIYRLPDYPVFVDGRTDLFGDEILDDYVEVISGKENWQEILSNYQLDTLILTPESRLKELALHQGWRVLYQDQTAIVLTDP